jgi:Asp-tRNA(Asn)/Glu-tRNA(Gln) amidotransferase A subunit family amidase
VFWPDFLDSNPEVVEACMQALEFLQSKGVQVRNKTIPHDMHEISISHGITILSEFALALDYSFSNPQEELEGNTEVTLLMGKALTAVEVAAAAKIQTFAMEHVRNLFLWQEELDAIVSPTLGVKVPRPRTGYRMMGETNTLLVYDVMRYVTLANLLGLPALSSVPVSYVKKTGLLIGFQLMGDAWMEHKLLRIATSIECDYLHRASPGENFFDTLSPWDQQNSILTLAVRRFRVIPGVVLCVIVCAS